MMISFQPCLAKDGCGTDGTCDYQPIGMFPDRTCDYIALETEVATRLNSECRNSTLQGSFTYCNNLLKNSYPIASNCSCSPMTTMVRCLGEPLSRELTIHYLYRLQTGLHTGRGIFGRSKMFSFKFSL